MINSAHNYPISTIFDAEKDVRYIVPKYQREYVWKKADWENLFDDAWDNPPGHFLGSIICINRNRDALQTDELEVVDGQQRLTTLSLLFAAIHGHFSKFSNLDKASENELYNLRNRLLLKEATTLRLEPSHQNRNNQDYRACLAFAGLLSDVDQPANAGNRRIVKAFRYFQERLSETDAAGVAQFDVPKLRELLKKLNGASLVKIEVNSHSDAFTLFESLNNRGVPLSALDLIKNKLLAVLEKQRPESIDDNFTKWNRFLDNLTDNYSVQERFLRQFYNAFKHRPEIGLTGFPFATRSNIIRIYEQLIDKDAATIFADLAAKAKSYSLIIAPNDNASSPALAGSFRDLDRIGGAPAYVLLLYLLIERPRANLTAIADFLVKFFVRRSLTDHPPTRDLARNSVSVIEKLAADPTADALRLIQTTFQEQGWIATDDVFKAKLAGAVYDENVDATRFVLCRIEESHHTKEKFTDLWKRDSSGDFVWTVEHIFPQGPNIPKAWIDMIAGGDEDKARVYREQYVHRLGNLTISGYNSKLGNKSFVEKRDRSNTAKEPVGYRNGLYLNEDLKNRDNWTVDAIVSRTNALVKEAMALFALPKVI